MIPLGKEVHERLNNLNNHLNTITLIDDEVAALPDLEYALNELRSIYASIVVRHYTEVVNNGQEQ